MPLRACLLAVFVAAPLAHAQLPPLQAPDVSPHARVSQTVGLTEITVDYHRPAVNGRPVWGALVPYGEVWRAGANENTTFEVSSDVAVNGQPLGAGRYGLHMIPTAGTWTVIFSEMADAWGSFGYEEGEDALRVSVSPRPAPFQERLHYRFDDPTNTSTELVLHWEELEIPLTVSVNTPEVVLSRMERELRGVDQFFWQGWNQIAGYALQTNTRMEDAPGWADRSIALNRNGANLGTKMALLTALGRGDEAGALEADFYGIATEADVNAYGYVLLADAIAVFRKNVEDYPESWNVHDSLGEALAASGRAEEAIEHYEHARGMAPAAQHARIDGILAGLRGAD
jgi:hypothetical protein